MISRESLQDTFMNRTLIGDGATGTLLLAGGGFETRELTALALNQPDRLRALARAYRDAGAEILTAHTFLAHRDGLQNAGLSKHVDAINRAAIRLARDIVQETAGNTTWLAASIAPVNPNRSPKVTRDIYREQLDSVLDAGVDALFLETFTSIKALDQAYDAALRSIPHNRSIAIIPFLSPHRGLDASEVAQAIPSWHTPFLGLNCGETPQTLIAFGKDVHEQVQKNGRQIRLALMPSTGIPLRDSPLLTSVTSHQKNTGKSHPEKWATLLVEESHALPIAFLGGCCGTTPEYIHVLSEMSKASHLHTHIKHT